MSSPRYYFERSISCTLCVKIKPAVLIPNGPLNLTKEEPEETSNGSTNFFFNVIVLGEYKYTETLQCQFVQHNLYPKKSMRIYIS